MRRLVLFRHAKAEPQGSHEQDFDRPLAPEGWEAAAGMAAWLDEQGVMPDLVICSPAVRTRQTWEAARSVFEPAPEVVYKDALYSASHDELIRIVRAAGSEVLTLMLIGHNPAMEAAAGLLAESATPEVAARFERKFPTAAIAILDFEDMPWAAIGPKMAWMYAFETPKSRGLKE